MFALGRPIPKPGHLGIRSGLIDEDQPFRIEVERTVEPVLAPGLDVRTLLLGRVPGPFLCVRPRLVKKYQTVAGQACTSRSANKCSVISCSVISVLVDARPRMKPYVRIQLRARRLP